MLRIISYILVSTLFSSQVYSQEKSIFEAIIEAPDTASNLTIEKYAEILNKEFLAANKIQGLFSFGLSINNSAFQEQNTFKIGASAKKSVFPGEINFNSVLAVQVNNGNFIENLSDLSMSYDHHFNSNSILKATYF